MRLGRKIPKQKFNMIYPSSPKTVLILYVSIGSGHQKAAQAIEAALNRYCPDLRTASFDFLKLWPRLGWAIRRFYQRLIELAPGIWSHLYDHEGVKQRLSGLVKTIYEGGSSRVRKLLDEYAPSAVVCTQATPGGFVSAYKARGAEGLPLVAVPTDYTVHAYWIFPEVTLYLVPSESGRQALIRRGVLPERIKVTGIPVHPDFVSRPGRFTLQKKYGLESSCPAVLLMGGGDGLADLCQLIRALDAREEVFQIAAVSGRNPELQAGLERMRGAIKHPLKIFSFVPAVDELMEIADLIVTKPGGLTTSEAMAKGLPMVLIDPLPGQEELNARFLERAGVALRAADCCQAAELVSYLLNGSGALSRMKISLARAGKPDSARDCARFIRELITGDSLPFSMGSQHL